MQTTGASAYVSPSHAQWLATDPQRRWHAEAATLAFADVSGFTAMSERLARRGKIGAEETTEAINRVFVALEKVTRDAAGELLAFGGDAILAVFRGEGHAARGAAAALEMQAAMRRLRQLRTAAGPVTLHLSAGVASGEAHLFLAGSGPRALLVAGPLATEVVALEAAAGGGQVLVGAGTAAGLPERCLGPVVGPGRFLRVAPLVPMVDIPRGPPGFDPGAALPDHLHGHEPSDGEHRLASIGFVQVTGVDAVLRDAGPPAVAEALHAIVDAAATACRAHGVTLVSTDVSPDGAKVILAAGAPHATDADEDALLHALTAVVGTPGAAPLRLRAGANRGRIFCGDIGTDARRTWTVMGDAVNLAARVMARAEPGQVLATPAVLERVRDDFPRTPVPPFRVKGKAAPVRAEVVGAARGARSRRRAVAGAVAETPLIGREPELMVVSAAFASARQGRHVLVELVGEAGIGKSRLVEAAVEDAAGLTVISVAGGAYAAGSPYRAVHRPLRTLLGPGADEADDAVVEALLRARIDEVAPSLREWLPLVAIPFGLAIAPTPETAALSPEFARARLHAATGLLIERILPPGPVLLVIEDAHWLDEASSDFLGYLARQRRTPGGCLLVTRRDVPGGLTLAGEHGAARLPLKPLDRRAALRLVRGAAEDDDRGLQPGVEDALVERAGGNPLLLSELVAAVRAGAPPDELPDTVEALVAARIDTLDPRDRQILRQAAVLGQRVTVALLGEVLELDAFALRSALRRLEGFLELDGRHHVRFRHALLRDAAYEGLPFRRRRELHARFAELVERRAGDRPEQDAELLALHFGAAHRWPETWRYAAVAAEQALARAAPTEAAAYLGRAIEAGRAMRADPVALATLGERQGEAHRLAGRLEDARRSFERARRDARSAPVVDARLCLRTGRLRERAANQADALRWLTRALTTLGDEPGREAEVLRAEIWLSRAVVRLRRGHMVEGVRCAERAAEIAAGAEDRSTAARAAMMLHWAYTEMGSPERERYRDAALPVFVELGDLEYQGKALNNLGIDAYWSGRWDEAVALYERGREALERAGDVIEAAVLRNNVAEIRSDQGRLDEAEEQFREVLLTLRGAGFLQGEGLVLSNLGRVAVRRGDVDRAAELFAQSRATLERAGADTKVLELQTREAERLIAAGEPRAVLAMAPEIRATIAERREQPAHLALTERLAALAHLQLGEVDDARAHLEASVAVARPVAAIYEEALSLEVLGRCGGPGAAEAAATAAELLTRLGVVAVCLPALPLPAVS